MKNAENNFLTFCFGIFRKHPVRVSDKALKFLSTYRNTLQDP